MYRTTTLLLFYILLQASSCKKSEHVNGETGGEEYFAFGIAYGECQGDCAHFYCIQNGQSYADDINYFNRTDNGLQFKNTPLPDSSYKKIKLLSTALPAYLVNHTNQTFGCPDCRDQGLIYIETIINGQKVHWMIDPDESKQPAEIKSYVQQLTEVRKRL